jgi:glycine betaine/choline ABC-type transport system substrate-binding protein
MKKIGVALLACLLVAAIGLTGCAQGSDVVRISHKEYTEQRITGQLMAVYLESKGFEVEVTELTGTMLNFTSLDNGDTDVYAEFTGSAYGAILGQSEILGVQETYDYVKSEFESQYGITWLEPLGWNNTYVLSLRQETVDQYGLETIDDLIAVAPELVMGCDKEFQNRADGLPGLKAAYEGLEFKDEVAMDQGLTYAALNNSDIDVNVSYSTDGRIAKFGLVNIEDNKNFFPPYYVTPILKMEYADAHPDVVAALKDLGGKWTTEDLQKYNLMVDEGADAKETATMMLKEAGLID